MINQKLPFLSLSSIQDMAFVFINNHFISISRDISIIILKEQTDIALAFTRGQDEVKSCNYLHGSQFLGAR